MTTTKLTGLRLTALSMVALLVVQFVAGIAVNLYVRIPATIPGTRPGRSGEVLHDIGWALANGAPGLRIHVGVAILLVAASLVMAGFGIATRRAPWVVSTLTGAVMILAAADGGVGFLAAGGHSADSLLMALGFMGALLAYGTGFYLGRDIATHPRPAAGQQQEQGQGGRLPQRH